MPNDLLEMLQPTQEIRERVRTLREEIEHHNYLYHTLDAPEIDDATYDALFHELVLLEKKYPMLKESWSPTLRIGAGVLKGLPKKAHQLQMYSLDNVFSAQEWEEFVLRMERAYGTMEKDPLPLEFYCDPKLDGLALELLYENGVLVDALTRGDGVTGEVVTDAVRTIKTVPLQLRGTKIPPSLQVRGEVVMFKEDFQRLNSEQTRLEGKIFANPRNAAAGTLRQLDLSIVRSRPLHFFAYSLGAATWGEEPAPLTHEELMQRFVSYGFALPQGGKCCRGLAAVYDYARQVEQNRTSYPMEIDGCVIKHNDLGIQQALGFTARAPRFAVAFKFAPMQVETVLKKIEVQVGRTGVLTPVALLEPVAVGGVIVQRATLHNADEIAAKDIREGDCVIVQRAGDVIPEIVRVNLEKRPKDLAPFVFPKTCPACGEPVFREEGQAAFRCENVSCQAVRLRVLQHFVSKDGLDVQGFGQKLVEQLVQRGQVKSCADLLTLTLDDLVPYERMGEVLARKLLANLETAKREASLERVLCALGIPHVGLGTARTLAQAYEDLSCLQKATREELLQLTDVGPEIADALVHFFATPANQALLARFRELGLWPRQAAHGDTSLQSSPFKAKTVLFTGTLSMPRTTAQKYAEEAGAIVVSGVSRKLKYLVCGANPGSKLNKARALGIDVLDEERFLEMLREAGISC